MQKWQTQTRTCEFTMDEEGTYFFYYSLSPGFLPIMHSDSSVPLQS